MFVLLCIKRAYLIETDSLKKPLLRLLNKTHSGDATLYRLQLSAQSFIIFHESAPGLQYGHRRKARKIFYDIFTGTHPKGVAASKNPSHLQNAL